MLGDESRSAHHEVMRWALEQQTDSTSAGSLSSISIVLIGGLRVLGNNPRRPRSWRQEIECISPQRFSKSLSLNRHAGALVAWPNSEMAAISRRRWNSPAGGGQGNYTYPARARLDLSCNGRQRPHMLRRWTGRLEEARRAGMSKT